MASRSELTLGIAWVLLACPSPAKADKLQITSTPPGAAVELDGGIAAKVSDSSVALAPELSLEELVRQAKPAVVYLKGLGKSGSGFFVTGTGVIVKAALDPAS